MRFFDPSLADDVTDSDSSFFATYRRLFERLVEEEISAGVYPGDDELEHSAPPPRSAFPSFGYSHTPFASAGKKKGEDATIHQTPVRDFYNFFLNFQTRKSMGWLDQYRLSEAPDRRVKRLMEKENKRAREAGRREYNDTVRALAAFVRKRDPRYKAHQQAQQNAAQGGPEAESNRKAYVARMEQERQARANAFQAQSWQVADEGEDIWSEGEDYDSQQSDDEDAAEGSGTAAGEGDEDDDDAEPTSWDCVACDKIFRSEAAFQNHEQSAKHKKAVKALQRKMMKEDRDFNLDDSTPGTPAGNGESAGNGAHAEAVDREAALAHDVQAIGFEDEDEDDDAEDDAEAYAGMSKKAKKKAKQRAKAAAAAAAAEAEEKAAHESPSKQSKSATPSGAATPQPSLAFDAINWEPSYNPLSGPLPTGSFTCFGFGSLIWKPPPHVSHSQPGFIKGFTRRFAQHSVDHRGTPARPGRVVTLISAADWHTFKDADESPEGDIVWGVMYTIEAEHAQEVREYLDYREKNGYSPQQVDVYGFTNNAEGKEEEVLVQRDTLVYVGLPNNPAFVGPAPLPQLAERIFTCEGPSGRNDEYLLNLAAVTRKLSPQSVDSHLFELERRVKELREEAQKGVGRGPELVKMHGRPDDAGEEEANGAGTQKSRRAKKGKDGKGGKGKEKCNVCGQGFDSRSKLFTHVRDKGHALAKGYSLEDLQDAEEEDDAMSGRVKGKKGKKGKR